LKMPTATRVRPIKHQQKTAARVAEPARPSKGVLWLPVGFALLLAAFSWSSLALLNPRLRASILGASAILLVLAGIVRWVARQRRLSFQIELRPQHYLQACAHFSILLYWGWYWRPVYDAFPLLFAQLAFAYAFDMLLAWSRRDVYSLGFAPFPVIFSTNLFLWFKADWFYLQFLMLAVGFSAKQLIQWERNGRMTHVFNPSSFPLALFSLALIVTQSTSMTWGAEIASTQFSPPNIYLFLFLVALPGQILFGVTTMTMSAVVTTYVIGLIYYAVTGTYFFIDSYIPIAVFLGMHLLFTDPSTAPRTEVGRVVFGMLYGTGNVVLYALFGALGVPKFYDKLLPVPLMNLTVRAIDRLAPRVLHFIDPSRVFVPGLTGWMRNLAYVSVWVIVFGAMTAADAVGDHHPGHKVPFWINACQQGRYGACDTLASMVATYCQDGSGWSCNESGRLRARRDGASRALASGDFQRACTLGFTAGCQNASAFESGGALRAAPPRLRDYPVILRGGKGALPDTTPEQLYTRACDQGWWSGCEDLAGLLLRREPPRAAALLLTACDGGLATACSNLGLMHYNGDGIPKNQDTGVTYLKRSCDLGYASACTWLAQQRPPAAP